MEDYNIHSTKPENRNELKAKASDILEFAHKVDMIASFGKRK